MIKFYYLDANCLVKLVVNESGSMKLRDHCWQQGIICATTSFCFYEALGVLKVKWIKKDRPDNIPTDIYLSACEELCALIEDEVIQLEDVVIHNRHAFNESEKLTKKYNIDLSDSFQLYSIREGMLSQLKTTVISKLITEDRGLYEAAIGEKLVALRIEDLNQA